MNWSSFHQNRFLSRFRIGTNVSKMVYDKILGDLRKEKITAHDTDEVLDFLQTQAFKGVKSYRIFFSGKDEIQNNTAHDNPKILAAATQTTEPPNPKRLRQFVGIWYRVVNGVNRNLFDE